jgi:hypothetical protein
LRKKLARNYEERITYSGKHVFIRPPKAIIQEVFQTEILAESIVKKPTPRDMPHEVYESMNFAMMIPKLCSFQNGTKYSKGKVAKFYQKNLIYNALLGDALKLGDNWFTIEHFEEDVCVVKGAENEIAKIPLEFISGAEKISGRLSADSGELPIVHLGLMVSTDETSGNTTKRWNHFENIFMRISNLPKQMDSYRLIASSNNITWSELSEVALRDFVKGREMQNGFKVWNAHERAWNYVVATIHVLICDNPRALDICSMVGPSGSKNCRYCYANRATEILARNKRLRSKQLTLRTIEEFHTLIPSHQLKLRQSTGIKLQDYPNIFFQMTLDPHLATPPELLHTILLGVVKHVVTVSLQKNFQICDIFTF